MRGSGVWLAFVIALVGVLASVPAIAGGDARELKGRTLFAKGEYQAALEIYATLFAEEGDPVYLRNIGRCYQKLRQPAKAIDSFQEYLRRSSRLKASERRDIETFIQEMKRMKAEQEAAEAAETPPPPRPPAHPEPDETTGAKTAAPLGHLPPPIASGAGSGTEAAPLVDKAADNGGSPPSGESRSLVRRWWFWTGIGAVVLGAVVTGVVIANRGPTRPSCDPGYVCPLTN